MKANDIVEEVFQSYQSSGILVRGNDGQTPTSIEAIKNAISNITIADSPPASPPFSTTIQNQAPPYSASLLSRKTAPLLWYNFDYVEAFKQDGGNPMGSRTIVAAIFNNGSIRVRGGCVWDADSNLRNLGNIPANARLNRSTPTSLFAQLDVFDGVAGCSFEPPTSLNNHPLYNPLFLPRVNHAECPSDPVADTEEDVSGFLCMIGDFKAAWVDALKRSAGGQFNDEFANYLNDVYQTGLEPEILIEPKARREPYYERRFDCSGICCVGFFSDGKEHGTHTLKQYRDQARSFLKSATNQNDGWMDPSNESDWPPLLSITGVALPDVPLSGTSAEGGNVGHEWVEYLTLPRFGYDSPLRRTNFRLIE